MKITPRKNAGIRVVEDGSIEFCNWVIDFEGASASKESSCVAILDYLRERVLATQPHEIEIVNTH